MKHNPLQRRRLGALALTTALSAILLTACSSKPPGCADEETVNLVKSIYRDRWTLIAANMVKDFKLSPEETDRYNKALKLDIRDIVSDGYNTEARKHSCKGTLVFQTLSGASFSLPRIFTSQSAAEGGGKFLVQVEGVEAVFDVLGTDYNDYVMSKKK
jgi:hypothetical protein